VDAYLTNRAFYPVGTFDETQDGVGNPVVNQPLFRQDLAAPYATAGEFAVLDDISNGSYTTNLDPTTLLAPAGREFLRVRAGAAGDELAAGYAKVLAATGVRGHPFVTATDGHKPGMPQHPVGRRVDDQKLIDMNAYLHGLPDPEGAKVDPAAFARGRDTFATSNCTACHNVDQGKPVSPALVEMRTIFPGYSPTVMAERAPPLTPVQNAPGGFDDKMIVVDASDRGDIRGNAIPMLLDLARKPMFLHDASVPSLDALLDPPAARRPRTRSTSMDAAGRADVVAFLKGVDTAGGPGGKRGRPGRSDAITRAGCALA
jgi:mono/diheme cytochrome c family protein